MTGAQAAQIGGIVRGTPLWVYPLLALLIYLGWRASRPRSVGLVRVLATPAVFVIWGIQGAVAKAAAMPILGLVWLGLAGCGFALAWLTLETPTWRIERADNLIHLPGSWVPLLRNLAIFSAKYGLAVAAALNPSWRDRLAYWDIGLSGAMAGYFAAWLVRLTLRYRLATILSSEPEAAGERR